MKMRFLLYVILCCILEKAVANPNFCIFLNQSKSECTIDLKEVTASKIQEVDLEISSRRGGTLFHPLRFYVYNFYNWRSPSSNQFSLLPNEYKCIKCEYSEEEKNSDERIVIRKNGSEVGAVYPFANFNFDKESYNIKFIVNEALEAVLYQKHTSQSNEHVIKILDFDKNVRYISPENNVYTPWCGLADWYVELPTDDTDSRPLYTEIQQEIPDMLMNAKQKDSLENDGTCCVIS